MIVKNCEEISCPFFRRLKYNVWCFHPEPAKLPWPHKTGTPPQDCPLRKAAETIRLDENLTTKEAT